MPLSRSSTRNKSRSPAPPISQSSPQYFPPSHFAVAGGFCLPDRENAERNRSASFSEEHPSQDAYMPVSYLSSASSDPSSFDYNGNHTTESRPRKSSAESSRKKRESQIHNLPLVEAHLLPSLRDTIDKMTRPPSRMTTSSNTNTPTITLSRQNGSEDYSSGGGSIDISSYPPPSPRLKPPSTRTPTTENRPTTEKRAATPKTGSVLKSALKAPTPRLSSSPSPSPTPAPVLSPGGGALKSVRSLLRRKSSSSTAVSVSSASDDQTTKENQPAISFGVLRQLGVRSRSRTDPGSFVSANNQTNTPISQSDYSSTSRTHQTPHTSHIPRFHGGTSTRSARQFVQDHRNDANVSTDDSDLEYRLEAEGRDRRKLTVTNAMVVPSSSSESEDDPSSHSHNRLYTYGHAQRLPGRAKPSQSQGQEGKIGLGLMFTDQGRSGEHGFQLQQDHGHQERRDRVQIYHEDHHYEHVEVNTESRADPGAFQRQSRSSIASYPSAGSIYTDDEEAEFSDATGGGSGVSRSNASLDLNELDETHSRRKAALLGLVRGLDDLSLRSNNANDPDHITHTAGLDIETSDQKSILSEAESDYCGEKGLALSGSLVEGTNGHDGGHQEISASESESEYDEGFGAVNQPSSREGGNFSTPPAHATPKLGSTTSNVSRRSNRYSSPSEYTLNVHAEELVTANKGFRSDSEQIPSSKNSKRHSLHPSSAMSPSPSPVPSGRYNDLPLSPRLPRYKEKSSPNTGGSLRSRIPQATISDEKDKKVISKRKSYTRDLSPSAAISPPPYASPISPASTLTATLSRHGSSPTPGSTTKREPHNSYESVVLAKRSMEALVRTRQAFGIPPSESDIYRPSTAIDHVPNKEGISRDPGSSLPSTDSMTSGVDVSMERASWEHEVDNELSVGAENLFRTLSQGGMKGGEARGRSHRHDERRRHESKQHQSSAISTGEEHSELNEKSRSRERRQSRHRSRTPVARPSSTQRTADSVNINKVLTPSSWRSMVGPDSYRSLLENFGEMEVQRQEMIWEMRTAETAFVERLSSVVSLFIIPLRIQTTKTWIAGVPLEIAKVLDWLEDIVNLHTQIRDTLQSFQTQEIPFADISEHQDHDRVGVAYTLRSFVPRFEIYQPYLVKLSGVLEILERLVGDNGSDFGEFVRLQEKTPECRASFGNMLLEPADRVATYPGLFQKFLDVTPKDHKEYLPTLMLVHATTLVVKTLQTVKAREEEYELIKSISERIDGLPTATNLARRDRRLLCHGQLLSLDLHQHLRNSNSRWTPNAKAINTPNRTNRLVDAINDWDTRRSRSGSVKSNNSASTGVSFRSVETSSPPPPPQVMVLVFSDLVVLATTRFSLRESSNQIPQEQQGLERWTVCEDIGVTRVLEVHEIDSNVTDAAGSPTIAVDLIPVSVDLNQSSLCAGTHVKTLQFQLPMTNTSKSCRESWISAFRRSSQSTLRNLSNPGLTQAGGDIEGPNHLLEQDRRRILESILQTGLPLPKSPSLQLADDSMRQSDISDPTQMEREERGWWSLQFQQLLRENWYGQEP